MSATRFVGVLHALMIVSIFLMFSCSQGHSAPSLTPMGLEEFVFGDSVHTIQDTTETIWAFFAGHPKPQEER